MDKMLKPIKGKIDMPKYQVTIRIFFYIPNPREFNNVNAKGGRVIKGWQLWDLREIHSSVLKMQQGTSG
jgi:hypothetical protein